MKKENFKLLEKKGAVLVIVDVQEKLLPKIKEKGKILKNILKLVKFAKIINLPIVLTEQYPKGLGKTVNEIRKILPNIEPIQKTTFSCFGSKNFKEKLKKLKVSSLIIVGIETHICVLQTALEAIGRFKVFVVADATSSRSKKDWQIAIERMREEGVTISSTEMLIFELLKDTKEKEFKKVLELLK